MADATIESRPGGMSEQRRRRIRLEISREAARLFWDQGVAATSGEQIAEAVGLSVRTIWRHFRTKESCAEPIVTKGVEWFVEALRRWPPQLSLEEHFAEVRATIRRTPEESADDLAGVQMIILAETEPAIRSAWLMACDQIERELVAIIASRLRRPLDDVEVRRHAAAATAAIRVLNEAFSPAVLAGDDLTEIPEPFEAMARAVRVATSGVVGDPVEF